MKCSLGGEFVKIESSQYAGREYLTEHEFRFAFENSPISMSFVNSDLKFVHVNLALCRLLGFKEHELIGRSIVDVTHPDDRLRSEGLKRKLLSGEIKLYGNEKRYLSKTGESIWVKMTAKLAGSPGEKSSEIFALIEDISARKELEIKRGVDVQALKDSNRHLSEFSRMASHDLKEPLNSISGFVSLIADQHKLAPVSEIGDYLESIERAANRGRALVDNLLIYAHLEELKPDFEQVDLNTEIADLLQGMQSLTSSANANVLVEDLPTVKGDRCQLSRLFQNLISNALKFSHADQRVVTLKSKLLDQFWIISVSDNGPGICDKDREDIFLPFRRGRATASIAGTGLGLSICKRIAELHEGKIWVESTSSAGTVFSISLPANHDASKLKSIHCGDTDAPIKGI